PSDAQLVSERWAACEDAGNIDGVIKACTEVIEAKQDPRDRLSMAFNNRGYAYARLGEFDRAMADLNEALKLDPQNPLAFINRGFTWTTHEEHEHAVADFPRALRLDPENPAALNDRCFSRAILGALTEALADCDESLRQRP